MREDGTGRGEDGGAVKGDWVHLALHLYNLSLPYPSLLPYQLSRLYGGHKSEVMQDRPILIFVTMSLMLKSKTLLCRSCEELPGKRGEEGKKKQKGGL